MQQIYRTFIAKCDFNKDALQFIEMTLRHGCSTVNLLIKKILKLSKFN